MYITESKCPLTELLISDTNFEKLKNGDDYLHQRTLLNSVQSLKLQRCCEVLLEFDRTHLNVLTISAFTAGQLNVNS